MRLDTSNLGLTPEQEDQLWEGEIELSDLFEFHYAADVELCQLPSGEVVMGMDRCEAFALSEDEEDMAAVEVTRDGAKKLIAVLVEMLGEEILPD